MDALDLYRREFRPSRQLDAPYAMAGVNIFAATTDEQARRLFTSAQQQFAALVRGTPGKLPTPVDDIEQRLTPGEKAHVAHMLKYALVGTPERVRLGLEDFVEQTGVDEVMAVSAIHDHNARLESFRLLAQIAGY